MTIMKRQIPDPIQIPSDLGGLKQEEGGKLLKKDKGAYDKLTSTGVKDSQPSGEPSGEG